MKVLPTSLKGCYCKCNYCQLALKAVTETCQILISTGPTRPPVPPPSYSQQSCPNVNLLQGLELRIAQCHSEGEFL